MEYTVKKGKKYKARIKLGWIESFADNGSLGDKFRFIGFDRVVVKGNGGERIAEGVWIRNTATTTLPPQVVEMVELDD